MQENFQQEIMKNIEMTQEILRHNMESNFETYCEMKARLHVLAYLTLQSAKK